MILLGSHMLKASTSTQHIIVRSSAESELYAALLGASESKGSVSLLCDLRHVMKPCWLSMQRPPNTVSTDKDFFFDTHGCGVPVGTR